MRSTDGRRSTYRRTGNWALGGRPLCRRDPGPAYRGHVSVRAQWLAMESLATLGLWASGGTARHVTASLGISPTRCVEPGEPIRPGCTKIAESSGWILHSDIEGPDVELDESLRSLLDKVERCAKALCELEPKAIQSSGVASWQPTTWNTTLHSIV